MNEQLERAAQHWSLKRSADGSRWWMHSPIVRHVNALVCGEAIDGVHQGFTRRLERLAPAGGYARAISVGCGSGGKEVSLLRARLVQRFDLFEIAEFRRAQIQAKADEHGVGDRVTIHIGDAFAQPLSPDYDLVYWNNSLHHMFDARQAVSWSHRALRTGGIFAMDDFVGPTRFQWTDSDLEVACRVRGLLPDRLLVHPRNPAVRIARTVERPSIAQMMASDPTEAADSESILPALEEIFSGCEVIATGGVIYHLALNDVLANFAGDDDAPLLQSLLLLDEALSRHGHTHYAVALARKA